jgi:carbon-monoxide dehydrogenase large subunit
MDESAGGALHLTRFGVGQPVPRKEDPRLLRGEGRYTDDLARGGQLVAWVRRSDVAHGRLRRIDVAAARGAPGVVAVVTGRDLDGHGYKPLPFALPLKNSDGTPVRVPRRDSLTTDRVMHVGEPLAVVIAETVAAAKDAAELIDIEIEMLPAVVDLEEAVAEGAAQLHPEAPGNVALDWTFGDEAAVAAAFADAALVTRLRLVNNRVVVASMEPRSAVASYDAASGRYTLELGCQGVMGMRGQLATVLGVTPDRIHVRTGDVGGSFGMKSFVYPEYLPILHAARTLGRAVRWVDERSGSFLSDHQGRASIFDAALALDAEGRFLAARVDALGDMGGWLTAVAPLMQSVNFQKNTPGPYRLPQLFVRSRNVFTNTVPIGPYRGAGRPEGVFVMERLIDKAARETGRDPVELRRRNMVTSAEIPYAAASSLRYDSGDFAKVLDAALARADRAGYAQRRRQSEARGRLRGLGIAYYLEVTADVGKEHGGIRFEPDGRVTIVTGTLDYGQGHRTPFAQVLSDRLGVPFELIDLLQGDSDQLQAGGGTGGSRSIMASGTAILAAADKVEQQGRELAAHVLEAAPVDIRFENGRFTVAGTDRGIGLLDLAVRLRAMGPPPAGLPAVLDAALVVDTPSSTFPNGCHIAEVEIDPATGAVELQRYTAVNDFGTVVNPMIVAGQVHGGVVQGIGQALLESTVYGDDGQLLSGSFMDYAMPRAGDVSALDVGFDAAPATTNALGVKGCGEAGCSGALPAVMNAVVDALSPLGIDHIDMPATPERVWRAIQAAPARRAAAA